jgi:hypothetical protein
MKTCPNCKNEFLGRSLFCSDACFLENEAKNTEDSYPEVPKELETTKPVKQASTDEYYKIKTLEVQKINLQEEDVLMVTIKHDEITMESMQLLRNQFKRVFPDNEVFVMAVGTDGDVKFALVSKPEISYCSDCDCGKKERAESRQKENK